MKKKTTQFRSAILVGLFLSILQQPKASLTEKFYDYIFPSNHTFTTPDSSIVSVNSLFNNIAHTKTEYESKDSSASLWLFSHKVNIDASWVKEKWGVNILLQNSSFNLESYKIYSDRGKENLNTSSMLTELTISPWLKNRYVTLGINIGKTFSPDFYRNYQNFTIEQPVTFLSSNREVVLGIFADIDFTILDFHFSDNRSVISAQTPEYSFERNGHIRTAPISLISNQLNTELGVKINSERVYFKFDRYHLFSDSLTTGKNALPFITDWYLNNFTIGGTLKKLSAFFSYGTGDGYLNGYDSDKDNASRYLIFNNMEIKKSYSKIMFSINKNLNSSFFVEYLSFQLPGKGYIDFYPFSSWTIFKSEAYRLSNGNFSIFNTGISLSGTKKWHKITSTSFEIKPSFLNIKSQVKQEKKKIFVLFPIYTNDTLVNPIDTSAILFDIKLSQQFNIKKIKIDVGIEQLIPILLNKKEKSNSDNTSIENPNPNPNPDPAPTPEPDPTPHPKEPSYFTKKFGFNTIFLNLSYRF